MPLRAERTCGGPSPEGREVAQVTCVGVCCVAKRKAVDSAHLSDSRGCAVLELQTTHFIPAYLSAHARSHSEDTPTDLSSQQCFPSVPKGLTLSETRIQTSQCCPRLNLNVLPPFTALT